AKYPNVRQGPHVLITVSEIRATNRQNGLLGLREADERTPISPGSESPGVDLGALQQLIGECGGHLWMEVEPPGNMVLKIHLPLRTVDAPTRPGNRAHLGRVRAMGRWFHS